MDLKRLNRVLGYDKLSLEDRVRMAVRVAKSEMTPQWIAAMKALPGSRKLTNANSLFVMARQTYYNQARAQGLNEIEAWRAAAARMLRGNDW